MKSANFTKLLFASLLLTGIANADPTRVACVGDSITQGSHAPKGQSYPDQLQTLLGANYQVHNFGVSARTLLRKGDYPYWNNKAFKASQVFQPDIVVIMLGTNDTKPKNWAHKDDFYQDYKDLVATYTALPGKPRVFICRPVFVAANGVYGISEANVEAEIPLIDKIAAEDHLGEIDLHQALEKTPGLLVDHVHPNAVGYGILAKTVAAAIEGN